VGIDYDKDNGSSVTMTITPLDKINAITVHQIIERIKQSLNLLMK
jgi:hypothetical protein